MLRHVVRKVGQLTSLFVRPGFSSYEKILNHTKARFSSGVEVRYYEDLAEKADLSPHEDKLISTIMGAQKPIANALVIGCGAGREIFALEKRGISKLTGIDFSSELIEAARKLAQSKGSKAEFITMDFQTEYGAIDNKYDLIYVTPYLFNLIPGRHRRIDFLKAIQSKLGPQGLVCSASDVFTMRPTERYFFGSQLLRVKALFSGWDWMPGDTLRSYLGNHNRTPEFIFYHYYSSRHEIHDELKAAGFSKTVFMDHEYFYAALD